MSTGGGGVLYSDLEWREEDRARGGGEGGGNVEMATVSDSTQKIITAGFNVDLEISLMLVDSPLDEAIEEIAV